MDPNNSTSHHDQLSQDLSISILAFTVAGFLLSLYATGRVLWQSSTTSSPRTISDEEAKLVAITLIQEMPDVFLKNSKFLDKLAGAVAQHED